MDKAQVYSHTEPKPYLSLFAFGSIGRVSLNQVENVIYRVGLLLLACLGSPITYAAEGNDPPIITASVSPSRVVANAGTIRISYSTVNATYCTYEGQRYPANGSGTFGPYPEGSHSARFSCTGPGGTRYRTLRWTAYVPSPPPETTVSIVQSSVFIGQTATLRWRSSNTTRCSTGGTEGTRTIGPWSSPGIQTVSVTCYGPGGQATDSDTVTVTARPRPVISTEVSPRQVEANTGQISVQWSSRHADYCTYEGVRYPASGRASLGPFAAGNHSATFTCTGAGGTTPQTVSWQAIPAPSVTVTQSLTTLTNDNTLRISWDSSHADSCRFQGRDHGADGSVTIGPFSPGSYSEVLRCSNAVGSVSETVRWMVEGPEMLNLVGFDYQYRVYGKADSADFFVSRDDFDGNNAGVSVFYLQTNNGPGSRFYNLVYPVTETTASNAGFNTASPLRVEITVADFNADGTYDLFIENLESAGSFAGRMDVLVYSRAGTGSPPLGHREIDTEFRTFFSELNSWLGDTDYFDDNAPAVAVGTQYFGFFLYGKNITAAFARCALANLDFLNEVAGVEADIVIDPVANTYRIPNGFDSANATGVHLFCYNIENDYSGFNQDALAIANSSLGNYLATGVSNPAPLSEIWQVFRELFGVAHGIDDEPGIINTIRVFAQVLFGIGVPQSLPNPTNLNRVELLFTDIGWPGLPPLARHAYVLVTTPSGNQYVTRGGPERPPSYGLFGELYASSDRTPIAEEDFEDIGATVFFRQLVGYIRDPAAEINAAFIRYSSTTNAASIDYRLLTQNSNSYAFQAVERLTRTPRPRAIPYAPGWSRVLPAP